MDFVIFYLIAGISVATVMEAALPSKIAPKFTFVAIVFLWPITVADAAKDIFTR